MREICFLYKYILNEKSHFFLKTILIYNDMIMTFENYETKNHSKIVFKWGYH